MAKSTIANYHLKKFKTSAEVVVFAPGRVNFIGEHTDYNGGLVMPLALDRGVWAAVSRNRKGLLRIQSLDFRKYGEFGIGSLKPEKKKTWANCPMGMVQMMIRAGRKIPGLDLTMTGNLPIGAGLSSSAAAEVATGFAVKELFGFGLEGLRLALLAQQAEHEFTGAKCGIMDQAISVLGKKDTLLKLSCRDLGFDYIPFNPKGLKLLIVNTGVRHNLAHGEYNLRRKECGEAFCIAKKITPDIESLSDFTPDLLEENKIRFPGKLFNRAKHVLSENGRVKTVAAALARDDFVAVGREMATSHKSLQEDFEVSCVELDFLVDHAMEQEGVLGARMTGGGFGGCMIVLLEEKAEKRFRQSLKAYQKEFKVEPQVYEARASAGARTLTP
jgi:galactokinase